MHFAHTYSTDTFAYFVRAEKRSGREGQGVSQANGSVFDQPIVTPVSQSPGNNQPCGTMSKI
jgi:hypothetical protein